MRRTKQVHNNVMVHLAAVIVFGAAGSSSWAEKIGQAGDSNQGQPFVYEDRGKRDPFWKLIGPGGVIVNYEKDILISDMVLEGTVVEASGDSIAIINGNIVKLNDHMGLFIIKEITPNAVILQKGQERFTLKLKKEE